MLNATKHNCIRIRRQILYWCGFGDYSRQTAYHILKQTCKILEVMKNEEQGEKESETKKANLGTVACIPLSLKDGLAWTDLLMIRPSLGSTANPCVFVSL